MSPPAASVIVRARDKADTIERTFRALRRQTLDPEIVVVDSGSRDATLRIAKRFCDVLVEVPPEEFTYGRALNLGAEHASAPVHFALSAHSVPRTDDWVERAVRHYDDPCVAATAGARFLPGGEPLTRPFLQDAVHARRHRFWGYSNHAASWRAEVRQQLPFHERLPASEDREWSWRVLDAGWRIVIDPALEVDQTHRSLESWLTWYRRRHREMAGHRMFDPDLRYGVADLLRDWWWPDALDHEGPLRQRTSPRRAIGLAGKYAGARAGARAPD
jgi:rhamnosyltransferase